MSESAKILLIEDDESLRKNLAYGLRKADYVVMALPDGSDALDKVGEFCPDLVVTDIIMPQKEGIGLILELHKMAPLIPVIAISGGGQIPVDELLGYAKAFGVQRSLAKPFRIRELTDAVAEVLAELKG